MAQCPTPEAYGREGSALGPSQAEVQLDSVVHWAIAAHRSVTVTCLLVVALEQCPCY